MKAKRFWGLWVFLCLAFALMPAAALAANPRDVQVGGVNMGDGTVYYKNDGSTGDLTNYNARFDQNEGKLYLKNLSITSGDIGIIANIPITIVLEEGTSNSIIITTTGKNGGIIGTSGTVTGRGSLTVQHPDTGIRVRGLTVEGGASLTATGSQGGVLATAGVTVQGGGRLTATATVSSAGVVAIDDVIVQGGGRLTAIGPGYGLQTYGGDLTVDGGEVSGECNGDLGNYGIGIGGAIEVRNGGKITGTSARNTGIFCSHSIAVGDGSELTGKSMGSGRSCTGVYAFAGDITVSGSGKLMGLSTAASEGCGVWADGGNITVSGSGKLTGLFTAASEGCGVWANGGNITVSGSGKLTGLSTGISSESFGVRSDRSIMLTGGTFTAACPAMAVNRAPDFRGYIGSHAVTASLNVSGTPEVPYNDNADALETYKYLRVGPPIAAAGDDDTPSSIVITLHPEDPHVAKGQRATFSVAATGEGLGYQWQINRNDGKGWQTLPGATSASYTTSPVRVRDNGYMYKCWVSDGNRNYAESNAAVLYVANAGALPQTGDSAMPGLWLAMMALGGLGLLLTCWRRRA